MIRSRADRELFSMPGLKSRSLKSLHLMDVKLLTIGRRNGKAVAYIKSCKPNSHDSPPCPEFLGRYFGCKPRRMFQALKMPHRSVAFGGVRFLALPACSE